MDDTSPTVGDQSSLSTKTNIYRHVVKRDFYEDCFVVKAVLKRIMVNLGWFVNRENFIKPDVKGTDSIF